MRKIVIALLFLCVTGALYAQVATISDSLTGSPLEMVTLYSKSPLASGTTNALGQVDVSAFSGADRIIIRTIGYNAKEISFSNLERNGFKIALSTSEIDLDQVVISATRWSQPKRETPHKITTITAQEVAFNQPQTAADLLGQSGEVFIQKSQQGGGSPMIRGFATNRLLMAVDGVRMNTAIFRSGNLQNVISLNPFTIGQTEVFFGPGSVIYGSDAIGGVMHFYTLKPQFSTTESPLVRANAVGRYSSANQEVTTHADVNVGWKKWSLVTSFTHNKYGDLRMGSVGPEEYLRREYVQTIEGNDVVVRNSDPRVQIPSGFTQNHFLGKVAYRPSNKWQFTYALHYSETSDYDRYDRVLRYRNGKPRSGEWYYGPQVWMMNNFSIDYTNESVVFDRFSIRLAHQYFEESRHDRDFGDSLLTHRVEQLDAYSFNADFYKSVGNRSEIMYGVEGVLNDVNSRGTTENINTGTYAEDASRYPKSLQNSYAAYATYRFKPTDKWTLEAGARYSAFGVDATFDKRFYPLPFESASQNNASTTGSIGVDYNPTKTWSVSANISTGFRAPNVGDIGKVFDSEPGAVVVPNPNLGAEYAYNAEIDVAKVFGDFFKIDVAAYYTLLDNALVRRDYTLNGADSILYDGELSQVQAIQNAAQATVYGFQAGLEIKLPEGFSFRSNFNWQQGEEELDNGDVSPSRHAAPWFGLSALTYKNRDIRLELNAQYSGMVAYEDLAESEKDKDFMYAIDENGNPYSPGWYTLNFRSMVKLNKTFTVTGALENILDHRYRPYSSGLVAPGRNVVLSLRATF